MHRPQRVGVLLYHGGGFMEDRIIKLKSLELENFKNVKYGKIDFKEDRNTGKISNIWVFMVRMDREKLLSSMHYIFLEW